MTRRRSARPAMVLAAMVCGSLILTACSDNDDGLVSTTTVQPAPTTADGSPAAGSRAGAQPVAIDLVDAAAVAVKTVEGSSLLSIETEPGRIVWEATVVTKDGTEHEMLISAEDGELIDGPTKKVEDADDKAENRRMVAVAEVGYTAAAAAIEEVVPGVRLTELNLDTFKDRIVVWEGDLHGSTNVRWSVKIDARNGNVLEESTDADDDD